MWQWSHRESHLNQIAFSRCTSLQPPPYGWWNSSRLKPGNYTAYMSLGERQMTVLWWMEYCMLLFHFNVCRKRGYCEVRFNLCYVLVTPPTVIPGIVLSFVVFPGIGGEIMHGWHIKLIKMKGLCQCNLCVCVSKRLGEKWGGGGWGARQAGWRDKRR